MKKITKAVIPVAGLGTRFLPGTKTMAKEMFPIIDKPTIQYIVEECAKSGIEEILFITSPYKKVLEDHFDKAFELEHRLKLSKKEEALKIVKGISDLVQCYYVRQGEPKGSGHAIKLAKSFVGDDHFAVLYGDDVMVSNTDKPALRQLMDVHEKTSSNVIGCQEVLKEDVSKYGIIKFSDGDKIETIIEKPSIKEAPSTTAGLGRYIVSSKVFDKLDKLSRGAGNEYQFTDAMKALMLDEDFYVCMIDGTYYDVGSKIGYIKATVDFALKREDLRDDVQEFINSKRA